MMAETKNILHRQPVGDVEHESGSLIIEPNNENLLKKKKIPIKYFIFSFIVFFLYTLFVVLITWGVTKDSFSQNNNNCNEVDSNSDEVIYPNTKIRQLQHVAVLAPNITEARAWYTKYLGLRRIECPVGVTCNYMTNDMGVKIEVVPLPSTYTWIPPTLNGYHRAHAGLEVRTPEDYISIRQFFIDENVTIQGEHHYPDRSQSMYFLDLNGYGWEIFVYTDNDISIVKQTRNLNAILNEFLHINQ